MKTAQNVVIMGHRTVTHKKSNYKLYYKDKETIQTVNIFMTL